MNCSKHPRGRPPKTCSDCTPSPIREKRPRHVRPMRTCQHCGVVYKPKHVTRITFCSRECSYTAKAGRKALRALESKSPRVAVCAVCSTEFSRPRANKYCSEECRKEIARRKDRTRCAAEKESLTYQCRVCRSAFTRDYGDKRRSYCSDICAAQRKRQAERKYKRGRENHRRRARMLGLPYEPVSRIAVAARDSWKCGICRRPISRKAKWPDMMCLSLDHIVPMSRGGGHTYSNVQAAHFMCNSLKGAGTADDQLRLIG